MIARFCLPAIAVLALSFAFVDEAKSQDVRPFGTEATLDGTMPHARAAELSTENLVAHGRRLFMTKFTKYDGAGRPGATGAIVPTAAEPGGLPDFFRTAGADSNACRGCHNDPVAGGAGEFVANAFVSEGFSDADFDTVDPQFSNERGTPALSGSGLVELLAREISRDLRAQRRNAAEEARRTGKVARTALNSKGIAFGHLSIRPDGYMDVSELKGVDQDLLVRPFSQKGVFVSLRQFTVNALNAHHGMQAEERFGKRYTGTVDFDHDGIGDELDTGDVTALVAFQALLPAPVTATSAEFTQSIAEGRRLFESAGCATCHVPALPLYSSRFTEPNPFNPAGNLRPADVPAPLAFDIDVSGLERDAQGRVLVPVFSDFKRHVIADAERPHYANELLAQRFVNRDEFLTARLWGVGSTAPYGHRGDLTTLHEAIIHHGGEATDSRQSYEQLGDTERRKIIGFLQTLRIAE